MIQLDKHPKDMKLSALPPRQLYRRRCDVTGEGMNSGWLFEGDASTIKYKRDVIAVLRSPDYADFWSEAHTPLSERTDEEVLDSAFEHDICYYTDWEEEDPDLGIYYTLHGVELLTEADRVAYLNHLPCSDVERAAVVMAHDGYHVWVIEGEGEEYNDPRLWTGKQFVCIGNIWNHKMDDSIAVEVGKRELKHYSDAYLKDPNHYVGTAMNPNCWRFVGWQAIDKPLPVLMPKEYGIEDIPFD